GMHIKMYHGSNKKKINNKKPQEDFSCGFPIYRSITGSKTPASRLRGIKGGLAGVTLPVKARLVQLTISGG
ncbi:hypothetical protein, partial [Cytobacillus firmus]|uniref:hypothetical protein n=1 Tax=Cytobacillus firmus TaxID=1399 RepID=UPI00064EEC73